jgi:hypothetical protein
MIHGLPNAPEACAGLLLDDRLDRRLHRAVELRHGRGVDAHPGQYPDRYFPVSGARGNHDSLVGHGRRAGRAEGQPRAPVAAGDRQTARFRSGRPVSAVSQCALAVLNSGSNIDDSRLIFEKYKDFDLRIVRQAWGIKLEIKNAPAAAFVDGVMIKGLKEHLFAVLRDVVFISNEIMESGRFDLTSSASITNAVFHILRNARILELQVRPNLVVCWGGHSISREEYDYTKKVGYELGLRGLDVCTGCGPGAMKGPMKGATIGHSKQRIHRRALSRHHRAGHHRGRAAQPDRQPAGDHAGHRKAPRGLRAAGPRHRDFPGRRRHGRGDPVSARHSARSGQRDMPFPMVFHRAPQRRVFRADPPFIGATLGPTRNRALPDHHRRSGRRGARDGAGLAQVRDYRRQASRFLRLQLAAEDPARVPAAVRGHARRRCAHCACRRISRCTSARPICAARSPGSSRATSRNTASARSSATDRSN